MTLHRGNSRNSLFERKNITLIALFAVSAFVLLYAPVRSVFTRALYIGAPKIWNVGDVTHSMWNALVSNFYEKSALAKENSALRADVSRMQAQVLDRNLLDEKMKSLEETLGRAQGDNRVVAYVLARPGVSPYDTLVVDAGADNGIAVGDVVVYAGSGAIGEIVEITDASAKVKLYSSPKEEHLVTVGLHNIPVVAEGRGMGNFDAKVPQDSIVAVGDNVVLSKGGYVMGIISLVEAIPAEPMKRIFFRTPFNISEIRSVEILINKRTL